MFVGVGVLAQEGAGAAWGVGEEAFIPHGVGVFLWLRSRPET